MPDSTNPPAGQDDYPIDEANQPERKLSVTALLNAETANLVTFRKPFDLSQQVEIDALRAELGPDATLPADDGVHYLFYMYPEAERAADDDDKGVPVLLPEGHVRAFMLGAGLADSVETAQQFLYRSGLLPLHDTYAGHQL